MIPLPEEEIKFYEEQEVCHICKKKFYLDENDENDKIRMMKMMKMRMMKMIKKMKKLKKTEKLKIIVITPENLEELLITIAI